MKVVARDVGFVALHHEISPQLNVRLKYFSSSGIFRARFLKISFKNILVFKGNLNFLTLPVGLMVVLFSWDLVDQKAPTKSTTQDKIILNIFKGTSVFS